MEESVFGRLEPPLMMYKYYCCKNILKNNKINFLEILVATNYGIKRQFNKYLVKTWKYVSGVKIGPQLWPK